MGKIRDMYKLQKQAKSIKKKLKNIHIEAEEKGITIVMDGEQNLVSVKIEDEMMSDKTKLEENLKKAFEKGLKKSQQIAAGEMKDVMGDLGLPNM